MRWVEDNKLKNSSQQIISAVCSVIVNEELMITVLYAALKIQYILEAGVDVPMAVTTNLLVVKISVFQVFRTENTA